MAQPDAATRLKEIGFDAADGGRSPEELSKVVAADYERMGEVLRGIGFKPE
jgi:hypothetical protein